MAKALQNGNLRMSILVGGFLLTIATIVFAAGGIRPAIDKNSADIALHYKSGCEPSVMVRQDVSALKADSTSTKLTLRRIEDKLDRILMTGADAGEP